MFSGFSAPKALKKASSWGFGSDARLCKSKGKFSALTVLSAVKTAASLLSG